ncbi:hypothetical protein KC207_15950 [Phycicoccus sp. BSK3Z-2]|uniref:Uncharacterized protein n=1 Tax=Phycicoccus avicenniae TaxID=2828860 RepID=A0A941DAN1_9MICO|nr:hypothetical protein [Phycicoccus avicenniae]MBR7744790.1 hypothetical protein [Phycicoccus avicenniae]
MRPIGLAVDALRGSAPLLDASTTAADPGFLHVPARGWVFAVLLVLGLAGVGTVLAGTYALLEQRPRVPARTRLARSVRAVRAAPSRDRLGSWARHDLVVLAPAVVLVLALRLAAGTDATGPIVGLVVGTLAWFVARRTGAPRWAAAVAVLLAGAAPLAVDGLAVPPAAAVPALLALLLLLRADGGATQSLLGTAVAGVMVLLAPPLVLLVPALVLLLVRRHDGEGRASALVARLCAVLTVVLGAGVLLTARSADVSWTSAGLRLPPAPVTALGLRDLVGSAPLLLAVVAVAVVLGAGLRSVRPLSVVVLLGAVAAAAGGPDRARVVASVLPLVAVLVAGVAAGVWRYRPTRLAGRDVHRSGGMLLVGAAGVVVGLAVATWAPAPGDGTSLVSATSRGTEPSAAGPSPSSTSPASPTPEVTSTPQATPEPQTTPEPRPTASTDPGPGSGEPSPGPLMTASPDGQEPMAAAEAGRQLAENPAITTTTQARRTLRAGEVDPRVLVVLATLAARYELTVEDFADPSADGRRSVRIGTVDGRLALASSPEAGDLARSATAFNDPFRPRASYEPIPGGLRLLTLTFPEPT